MKRLLAHAAIAALAGWYLMVPPIDTSLPLYAQRYHPEAPLSKWYASKSFDNADDCLAARDKEKREVIALDPTSRIASPNFANDVLRAVYAEQCIATDDPRLAQ